MSTERIASGVKFELYRHLIILFQNCQRVAENRLYVIIGNILLYKYYKYNLMGILGWYSVI